MKLRLDRLLTVYLAQPAGRVLGLPSKAVPVLMYHSISDQNEEGLHPYYRTTAAPSIFARQMQHLQAEGYRSGTLASAVSHLQQETSVPEKLVVITFDDGFADFYQEAFPVLQRCGLSATMFLPTSYIGERAAQFKGKNCLTWSQVRELARHGITFGSHTATHPRLIELNADQIQDEVATSKKTIEDQLGQVVESFAYPYAFPQTNVEFKKMLRGLLVQAGYRSGVCTTIGRATLGSDSLFLERLPVNADDDPALFSAKLAGAYDWISTAQQISKMVKGSLPGRINGPKFNLSKELPRVQRPS